MLEGFVIALLCDREDTGVKVSLDMEARSETLCRCSLDMGQY